jgi:hypothetical protein
MAAAGAKLFAPLLETRHHLLKVVLVGVGEPGISGHERRPQRATGNADKCRLKPFGQGDGELYCFFRIMIHVDVHHQCRKRHEVFLFALISRRLLFSHPCSASVFLPACNRDAQCDNEQQTGLDARSSCVTPPKIHSPNRLCP